MEARAPIALGAVRSLEGFDPEVLREEAHDGKVIADALAVRFGEDIVSRTDLGPVLNEQDVLAIVMKRAGRDRTSIVPAEATAAIGMLMLRDHGVLTVNTHGQPGARVSFRLKPTAGATTRVGGAEALAAALDAVIDEVSGHLNDRSWFSELLFGEGAGL